MTFRIDSVGNVIWGLSCFFVGLCLLIYDGGYKRNVGIICGLFVTFLILQTILCVIFLINSYINSLILLEIGCGILVLSGNIFIVISTILFLSPLHRNKLMRIIIIYILPIIYMLFLIILIFLSSRMQQIVSFIYFIPCVLIIYITMIILYHWYKKERFIFAVYVHSYTDIHNAKNLNIHNIANWTLFFKMAIFSMTVGVLSNFIYPILVKFNLIPDDNPGFIIIQIINSLIVLPLIIPLIRSLDKVTEYTKYRIMQNQIIDHIDHSDPSDNEHEPLRD